MMKPQYNLDISIMFNAILTKFQIIVLLISLESLFYFAVVFYINILRVYVSVIQVLGGHWMTLMSTILYAIVSLVISQKSSAICFTCYT